MSPSPRSRGRRGPGRLGARHRRGPGPADLAGAGDRRCGRRPGGVLHGARPGLARAPRYDERHQRPAGAGLACRVVDSRGFASAAGARRAAVRLHRAGRAVRQGPADQPDLRHLLRVVWVGLVPLSLLLGPVWKAISPVARPSTGASRRSPAATPTAGCYDYPDWLGHWPAALGLYAFVWMELVYPHGTELGPVRLWLAAYAAVMLVGGALFGNTFYERADPFEVYSTLVAKLSVWGRRDDAAGGPQPAGQPRHHARPGRAGRGARRCCSAAPRSTRFKDSTRWLSFIRAPRVAVPAQQPGAARLLPRRRR